MGTQALTTGTHCPMLALSRVLPSVLCLLAIWGVLRSQKRPGLMADEVCVCGGVPQSPWAPHSLACDLELSEPRLPHLGGAWSHPGKRCAERALGDPVNRPGLRVAVTEASAHGPQAPEGMDWLTGREAQRAGAGSGHSCREWSDHMVRILPLCRSGPSLPLCWQSSQATAEARWPLAPPGFQAVA